jgi:hypothetical protein
LLKVQSNRLLDDLAEMFINRMSIIHQKGKDALADYHLRKQRRADELIQTLFDLVTAYRTEGSAQDKIAAMETLLADQGDIFSNAARIIWLMRATTILRFSGASTRVIAQRFFGLAAAPSG